MMNAVGIICEYNPFHNGHIYHINETKKLFPNMPIILILNGYFLQRGEISLLSKENKTKIALKYGVDLVVELPFIFGSQSADIFAFNAIKILNHLKCKYLVFGSESNNIDILKKVVQIQNTKEYNKKVKLLLNTGINYPTALAKASNIKDNIFNPNDLLGISYLKAIKKLNINIKPITIKRTSSYHNLEENNHIISASNIRNKIKNKESISKYIPLETLKLIEDIKYDNLFNLLKYKILTDNNLNKYLTVDEGLEFRLKEKIKEVNNIDDLIKKVKTKRYTHNKISRMFIHILLGIPKDINLTKIEYIKILGFNNLGKQYLHEIKKSISVSLTPIPSSITYQYELLASQIYSIINNINTISFDKNNKPIVIKK